MALLDTFLQEAAAFNVWIAVRADAIAGSGTAPDPYNGAARRDAPIQVVLTRGAPPSSITREAIVSTGSEAHGFQNGDEVEISGVTGGDANLWNGTFGIYGVTQFSFRYLMKEEPDPIVTGNPECSRLTFLFDEIMRDIPPNTRIQLGPGTYQTRGFAPGDTRGWQPKSGQKIVGAGIDVTVLQLVGADKGDAHYHAVGMPIEEDESIEVVPLQHFEVSDLTIDCNLENQPVRFDEHPTIPYSNVACGAVRILGNHCRVRGIKAINWGTKSLKQGCFAVSIINATGQPVQPDGQPRLIETVGSGIEDCIVMEPSPFSARESTALHLGGIKNPDNHAQGFGCAPFVRRNFVDCSFKTNEIAPQSYSSAFIAAKIGTQINGALGTFIGKREHSRKAADIGRYIRLYNVRDPASRWNGFFPILDVPTGEPNKLLADLTASEGSNNDSSLVVLGAEIRAIAVSSGVDAVVEQNQIHNCWIGGPYQSPLDDSVSQPTTPPTQEREEHLDPLNALSTRSLIVRNNTYKDVAVGPCFNMRGVSGSVDCSLIYNIETGVVTAATEWPHKLWIGARLQNS